MKDLYRSLGVRTLAVAMAGFVLVGCENGGTDSTASSNGNGGDDTAVTPDAAMLAVLVDADGLDGNADKVVHKCAGCALAMDGDPAHSSKVGDYVLHLCSAGCKEAFDVDPSKALLALKTE